MTKFEELILEEIKASYKKKIAKIRMKVKKARKASIKAQKELIKVQNQLIKTQQANQNMIKLMLENAVPAEVIIKAISTVTSNNHQTKTDYSLKSQLH